ncbi:MAG: hypothetical protein KKB70_10510 [Proteobacteria bacterium]|nr:hypothetical protein [Pseudomonadota bacterium]
MNKTFSAWPFWFPSVEDSEFVSRGLDMIADTKRRFGRVVGGRDRSGVERALRAKTSAFHEECSTHHQFFNLAAKRFILFTLLERLQSDELSAEQIVLVFSTLHKGFEYTFTRQVGAEDYFIILSSIRRHGALVHGALKEFLENAPRRILSGIELQLAGVQEIAEAIAAMPTSISVYLLEPDMDMEMLSAFEKHGRDLYKQEEVDGFWGHACSLYDSLKDSITERERELNKILDALAYVAGPVREKPIEFEGFVHGVFSLWVEECVNVFRRPVTDPVTGVNPLHAEESDRDANSFGLYSAASPLSWYAILSQSVSYAMGPKAACHDPEVYGLILNAIQRPKAFRKLPCPRRLAKLQGALNKHLAKYLVGFHHETESVLTPSLLMGNDVEDSFSMLAYQVARCFGEDRDARESIMELGRRGFMDTFNVFIAPHANEFIEQLLMDCSSPKIFTWNPDNLDDLYIQQLVKNETPRQVVQDDGDVAGEEVSPEVESFERFEYVPELILDEPEEPLTKSWWYVSDPWALDPHLTELDVADSEKIDELDAFFRAKKITTIVPTKSIHGAVTYALGAFSADKGLLYQVVVENVLWIKIKRGKARILCRVAEDGRVLFHVYPRREYRPGMFG